MSEGLIDLSLFAFSPSDDRHFSVANSINSLDSQEASHRNFGEYSQPARDYNAPTTPVSRAVNECEASKPSPGLPPRKLCGPLAIPRDGDAAENSISNRMKRKRNHESPGTTDSSLSRRRNVNSPPQLLLSAPQPSRANCGPSSELVWMPEEQMWLVVGEGERDSSHDPSSMQTSQDTSMQAEQPSLPTNRTRSAPTTGVQSQWHATPPLTPIQSQLQSLIEQRDEERLSPLFQQAMNSVPMEDAIELPPPPTYEGIMRERSSSNGSNQSGQTLAIPPSSSGRSTQAGPSSAPLLTSTASSGSSNYATAPTHPSVNSSVSEVGNMSQSYTGVGSRSRLKPATSKYAIWSPPESWGVTHKVKGPDSSRNQSNQYAFVNQNPASTKSWAGWAKMLARPRSAT